MVDHSRLDQKRWGQGRVKLTWNPCQKDNIDWVMLNMKFAFLTLYNSRLLFSTMPRALSCTFNEVDLESFPSQFDSS